MVEHDLVSLTPRGRPLYLPNSVQVRNLLLSRPSALDRTDQTEASNRQPYDERPPTDDTASEG